MLLVYKYNYKYFVYKFYLFSQLNYYHSSMKIGKLYVKFNFYDVTDDIITNTINKTDMFQYGTLTFNDDGILTEWSINKDFLKEVCDRADKEVYGDNQYNTFDFCWQHSIKNKTDYPDNGLELIKRVNESWFTELTKLSKEKENSLIIYSWS
jgi:hypothetical protein